MLKDCAGLDENPNDIEAQKEEQMEFGSNIDGCRMLEQIQGLSRQQSVAAVFDGGNSVTGIKELALRCMMQSVAKKTDFDNDKVNRLSYQSSVFQREFKDIQND